MPPLDGVDLFAGAFASSPPRATWAQSQCSRTPASASLREAMQRRQLQVPDTNCRGVSGALLVEERGAL